MKIMENYLWTEDALDANLEIYRNPHGQDIVLWCVYSIQAWLSTYAKTATSVKIVLWSLVRSV